MPETITLADARLRAHQERLRTDADYRRRYEYWKAQIDARLEALKERRRQARERRRLEGPPERLMTGSGRYEGLPLVRVWMRGRSRRRFKHSAFTFENEIRERILAEVQPGVVAMWSDPFEQLGIARTWVTRARAESAEMSLSVDSRSKNRRVLCR